MKRKTKTRKVSRQKTTALPAIRLSWGYLLLAIFCACIMAAGFFFAGLQHFATMDLGFKNSNLRKAVDELEAEKRRLILAREVSLSPNEILRTARAMGFREAADELPSDTPETPRNAGEIRPEMAVADARTEAEAHASVRRQPDEANRPRIVAERPVPEKRSGPSVVSAIVSAKPTSGTNDNKKTAPPPTENKPTTDTADTRPRRVASENTRRTSNATTAELR